MPEYDSGGGPALVPPAPETSGTKVPLRTRGPARDASWRQISGACMRSRGTRGPAYVPSRTSSDRGGCVAGLREMRIESARSGPGLVEVAIRDTGIGVKAKNLELIFDRFVSTRPDGLGMGLSISRTILEAHGGRIWATANTDGGITLHVELRGQGDGVQP
jgi:hypothetical protein